MNTPSLFLVQHFRAGAGVASLGQVPWKDVQALIECFTEAGTQADAQCEVAHAVLARAIRTQAWFACGCTRKSLAASPILYPQRTRGKSLMLVRNYDRAAHDPSCPFSKLRPPPSAAVRETAAPPPSGFDILRFSQPDDESRQKDETTPRSSGGIPRLARIMFRLLIEAGLTRIGPEGLSRNAKVYYSALGSAVAPHSIGPNKDVPLNRVFRFGFGGLSSLQRTLSAGGLPWPHPIAPQGFIIAYVKGMRDHVLDGRDSSLPIHGSVTSFGADTPGARLAIILVGQESPGTGPFIPLRAYTHPLYTSTSLLLVDSDLERKTLDILLGSQRWLTREKDCSVTIEKPIADVETPSGAHVRPDFILSTADGCRLCIETMGFADDGYRERKSAMHALMAELGPVVCHEPGKPEADKILRQEVARFFLRHTHPQSAS